MTVTPSSSWVSPVAVRSSRYFGLAVAACSTSPSTRVRPLTAGEAGHVEDLLLRVHRGDLPAELGQRVDDRDPVATEAGVVGREQAGGPGADDQDVGLDDRASCAHGVDPSTRGPSSRTGTCSSFARRARLVSRADTSQPRSVCTTVTRAR